MDLDAGISRKSSPEAVQRLLAKVKARKKAVGETDTNQLSAKLDELIELADYPKEVLQSSWRKIKKPSAKTMRKIRKGEGEALSTYRKLTPHVEDISNGLKKFRFISAELDELIEFQTDPRPRNPLGEFSGNEEGGPDPNAMVKTYRIAPAQSGIAPSKSGPGILGASGLTVLGGAGGAIGGKLGIAAWDKIGKAIKKVKK
jgi:hypothetical protein